MKNRWRKLQATVDKFEKQKYPFLNLIGEPVTKKKLVGKEFVILFLEVSLELSVYELF